MNLLRIPQREFEEICIRVLKDDCISCDMKVCEKMECPFRNKVLSQYTNFSTSLAKHWIYFFFWNTEHKWRFPTNVLGAWAIHHKDLNHCNDSEENLELMAASDHKSLHQKLSCNFNIAGKDGLVSSQRRAKNGIHHFQGSNNWQRHTERYIGMLKWLENLEGVCRITKELAKKFKYNCVVHMVRSIETMIKREFPNLEITKMGSTRNCKWYVSKKWD